nr:hypothetical protein ABT39_MTgene3836 [Picea glauca]
MDEKPTARLGNVALLSSPPLHKYGEMFSGQCKPPCRNVNPRPANRASMPPFNTVDREANSSRPTSPCDFVNT